MKLLKFDRTLQEIFLKALVRIILVLGSFYCIPVITAQESLRDVGVLR